MVLPDTVYTINTIASIDPGKTKSANTIYLENGNDIFEIWAGVSKVRYEDGTVVIIPHEEIVWDYWGPIFPQSK